jgi:hypothetical protein
MTPSSFSQSSGSALPGDFGVRVRIRRFRRLAAIASLTCLLALSGCGGGGELAVVEPIKLQVGVVAGPVTYAPVQYGQVMDVVAQVGQRIEFDANEPVVWALSVNGSPLFTNGTTVDLGGVTITQVQVTDSRVVLFSSFYGPALVPIDVLLTATSSIDAAQVATIRLSLH